MSLFKSLCDIIGNAKTGICRSLTSILKGKGGHKKPEFHRFFNDINIFNIKVKFKFFIYFYVYY